MLCELRVESLLLIERAQLRLAPGLNVLTGETGAGKTVLAHAVDLLMGGRARTGIVRAGAGEAYVEGEFALDEALARELRALMPDSAILDGERGAGGSLVLARRVARDGRTRAYVNGRSASVTDLRELGSRLLSFYGQHEHRKLTLSGAQLEILDRVCGHEQPARLSACADAHAQVRETERQLQRARELALARDGEIELLEHEIGEIEQACLEEQERERLLERRERLRRIDALRAASGAAAEALAGEPAEGLGAAQAIAGACARLDGAQGADRRLDELGERSRALAIEAQELGAELRRYCEDLEGEEGSPAEVEERLELYERLMRRHGGTVGAVLAHLQRARERRGEIRGAQDAQEQAGERLREALQRRERLVGELRQARVRAARVLERRVREQLGALAMGEATFEVSLIETAPRASGGDEVQFVIAPNPGVAAAPLREIASGGELSRVMLALATVASATGGAQAQGCGADSTLVFDEIDAGIGGHTARAVGERLREVARVRQVLCITHLPQIASLAERHFSVVKQSEGGETRASVVQLEEAQVLSELVRMLGADEQDSGAREHAQQLLRAA